MNIFPSLVIDGNVHAYASSPVFYIDASGRRIGVSAGYEASTREEVIKLALMNAQIRRGVRALVSVMAA